MTRQQTHDLRDNGGARHHQRAPSEDFSMNSSSTDSTRPTVHTKRTVPSAGSMSTRSSTGSRNNTPAIFRAAGGASVSSVSAHGKTNSRKRVPGGAAAKLMFRGPEKTPSGSDVSCRSSTYDSNDDDGPVDTSEIFDMISRTKAEFETGPQKSRLSPVTMVGDGEIEVSFHCTDLSSPSQEESKDLPHILNREEAYHENASAAVAAILTPRQRDDASMTSGMTDVYSTFSNSRISISDAHRAANGSVSAFQSPKFSDNASVGSNGSVTEHQQFGSTSALRNPTSEPLISYATEAKLDRMSQKMLDPSKTLSDLLRAIASPEDGNLDRAYMVRRKNACGALKVLTAHNRRRKQICWTVGVLPALTSVLQDSGEDTLELQYPDVRTRMEYEEARRRAIAALTNLAMPVPNRLAVFHTPGLVQALIALVMKEDGECLEGACAILAYLAKSNENKILMAQVPGLFEAVLRVLRPQTTDAQPGSSNKQQDYPWVSSVSDSDSSVSSVDDDEEEDDEDEDDGASILSGSTDMSSDGETTDDEEFDGETTDDDMSTDRGSMTGSEGSLDSHSSMSESSADDSGSENTPPAKTRRAAKGRTQQQKQKPQHQKIQPRKGKIKQQNNPLSPVSSCSRVQLHSDYDKDKYISAARKNLFAMLGHLAKEKDNAYRLARVNDLVPVVVEISKMHESQIHILSVQLLAHLTRHRLNSKSLVFKMQEVIPAMVKATYSNAELTRRYACFGIQNFSHDKSCRQELASSEKLITALCKRARHSKDPEERLAAICALKNLTDEPANLIPLSNTAECIATLMQIAHGQEEGVTEMMQFRACDALATISHWLRKIATNGQSMDAIKHGDEKPVGMFVPSLKVVGWEQYE